MKKECKWCYKEIEPKKEYCCSYCEGKYNNYLANDNSKSPWDKYVN